MVYTLKQSGRYIYISPSPFGQILKDIEKELSYRKKGGEFMPNPEWAWVKLYNRQKACFPVGLLSRVERIIKDNGSQCVKFTQRSNLRHFFQKDEGLYDFQKSALKMTLLRGGGILQIATGGGKTRTAISVINTLEMPTLVIVPTLDLVEQWKKQVPDSVHIRTYQGLKSKAYLQQFGLVIFDECHRVACKTMYKIGMNLNEKAVTLGLSATPFMRDDDNLKVEGILGPVIYKMSSRDLINMGYLVDAKIYYHTLKSMSSNYLTYSETYNKYILENIERNAKICHIAFQSDGPVLILVKLIEHGKELYNILKGMGCDVVFLNGSIKDRSNHNFKIIIATSIFDEGIDIPRLETLIMASGGKSAIKTTQRLGRVLRKFPDKKEADVHDFRDNTKWLFNHYLERRKIFEEDFEVIDK